MAKLFLAKDESHYYIVAGKSQGTFQLSLAGLFWLAQMQTPFPRPGRQRDEGVPLTWGTFRKLRDEGYLFTKGPSLSATTSRPGHHKHDDDDQEQDTDEAPVPAGLPLLLRTEGEGPDEHWQLFLDLSDLSEETWQELQQLAGSTAGARLLAGRKELASSESLRHLFFSPLLPVHPQAEAYQLCCQLPDGYYELGAAPRTPGLSPTWQGTLFYQEEEAELPRRLLRGERIKLYAGIRLYWLVQNTHDVQRGLLRNWPGSARPLGPPVADWQLWELELTPSTLATQDAEARLERWLNYSELKLQQPSWSLMLLSPPLLLPKAGSPVLGPHSKVIIGCRPPATSLAPLQSGRAVAMTLDLRLSKEGNGPPLERRFSLTGEASMVYVALDSLEPGTYQLGQGNLPDRLTFTLDPCAAQAGTDPLPPELLAGLRCTAVTEGDARQEFAAFSPTAEEAAGATESRRLLLKSAEEGATLVWELAPSGLPVSVSWRWCTAEAFWDQGRAFSPVTTGEKLTALWQQQIWPALARASQARLIFDGGALGCLEISLEPAPRPVAASLRIRTAQRAQLLWLGNCLTALPRAELAHTPGLPVALQQRLRALEQAARQDDPPLALALRRLLTARLQPWIVARLMAVFQEH
ncbi:hypothetical protein [Thermogemmatispora tikiterensis]|uniref:Uncharacterized protein n=1 Tax=Thermogemmatispora tikiterensis TaxID=1825093 RepID=A0A328VR46_9CHLR|nr:hypothetical protein [Thermogemmatispora tikiterensis]RAQ97694.1 hypothetical protein A4R35_19300 [Thermogemmatispora tikiterensis]